MANFAYIENGVIQSVYDILPDNWKNISNFNLLENDEAYLNSLGWYKITKVVTPYDPSTQRLGNVVRWIDSGVVYEKEEIINLDIPGNINNTQQEEIIKQWELVRKKRDLLINEVEWRIQRFYRETRMGLTLTDDIKILDNYIQELSDIPNKQPDPFNISWPVLGGTPVPPPLPDPDPSKVVI